MAVAGVIAEYNPFHRGHAWQIAEIRRRLGPDTAVAVCMSGNFVQRGDFALLHKGARAEMALLGGADLVLELPTPWACAGAERFAQGGVSVLAAAGVVDYLAFGCESGALEPLQRIAACLDSEPCRAALRRFLDKGMSFAAARQAAVEELTDRETASCLSQPNNALAVEYLRSLRPTGIRPLALPRVGAGHDSGAESDFPSADAIRERILSHGGWRAMLPEASTAIVSREIEAGRAPASMAACERALLARLRRMSEEDFRPYDGGNEGLYHRFYDAVRTAATLEDILRMAKTKRYPLARLRRMLLQSALGVPQAAQGETPPYLRVLGTSGRGRALLRRMKGTAKLPVLTKPSHIRRLDREAQRVFAQESLCTDLYVLACPDLREAGPGGEYRAGPAVLPFRKGDDL